MNFQNKIKVFLITLLRNHRFNEVIIFFSLWQEKKLTSMMNNVHKQFDWILKTGYDFIGRKIQWLLFIPLHIGAAQM